MVDKIVVFRVPATADYAYDVFFDVLSSDTNYKSKQELRKYENRQKLIIFGKKWPNQGDKMRIIAIQLSKQKLFFWYPDYSPSP